MNTHLHSTHCGDVFNFIHPMPGLLLENQDSTNSFVGAYQHIEAKTQYPPFCRAHFPNDFLYMKIVMYSNFSEFCFHGKAALVEIVSWRRTRAKPFSEPMIAQFTDVYMQHSASYQLHHRDVHQYTSRFLSDVFVPISSMMSLFSV